jgi:hypothetical protein
MPKLGKPPGLYSPIIAVFAKVVGLTVTDAPTDNALTGACVGPVSTTDEQKSRHTGQKIVLTTFGSLGDLHPYIALALGLQARGHETIIATTANGSRHLASVSTPCARTVPI